MPIDLINDNIEIVTVEIGLPGTQGPAGPQGVPGPTGALGPANTLTIGTITTGNTGDPAAASITGTAPNQILNLTIPRGLTGAAGPTGPAGADGAGIAIAGSVAAYANLPTGLGPGDAGKGYLVNADGKLYIWSGTAFPSNGAGVAFQGPTGPANTLSIGTVTTGAAGSSAGASVTGTAPNQILNLTIPTGATGPTGAPGAGIIAGGVADSVLSKLSSTDYDTGWVSAGAAATASTLVKRDSNGRAQVAAPSAGGDIANKTYVDDAVVAGGAATVSAATSAPTPSTLMKRDSNGRAQVVDPVSGADIATKTYADALGTSAATVSTIIRRDSSGRAKVTDPAAATDIATKQYVDGIGVSAPTASSVMRRDVSGRAQVQTPSAATDIANKQYVDDIADTKVTVDEINGYVAASVDMAPIIRRHNGTTVAVRPASTRPVWWIVPVGFSLPLTGTTAGGSIAAVNNLDLVSRYS